MTTKPKKLNKTMNNKNWEKEFWEQIAVRDFNGKPDKEERWNLYILAFIDNLLTRQKEELIGEILNKINKDHKGRDITIFELGDWLEKL